MTNTPYLVQRVSRRESPRDTSKGVDKHFSFDYMGSAEFEFGALPEALKRMRVRVDRLNLLKISSPQEGVKRLWFLGEPEYLPQAVALLRDQLGPQKTFLKERTYMKDSMVAEPLVGESRSRKFDAWWALDVQGEDHHNWLIFVQKADAQQWLKDLRA